MVKRKADELIRNFLLNDKRSLLVTGARQVGIMASLRHSNIHYTISTARSKASWTLWLSMLATCCR